MKKNSLQKIKRFIFENEHYLIYSILTSVILIFIMIFSFKALNSAWNREDNTFTIVHDTVINTIVVFGLTLLSNVAYFLKNLKERRKLIYTIYMITYLLMAIISIFIDQVFPCILLTIVYFLNLCVGNVIKYITNKNGRTLLISGLFTIIYIVIAIWSLTSQNQALQIGVILAIEVIRSLMLVLITAFSKMQFNTLRKIIFKTYTAEVLVGLLTLIVTFSYILTLFESFTFEDALWYCFAVVTTIGFGDFYATTTLGRILSVILGLYGIIVVAMMTSVIVNFYNEVKDDKELNKMIKEEKKEKDGK